MIPTRIHKVKKRDGRVVKFEPEKITIAIHKAIASVEEKNGETAERLAGRVMKILEEKFAGEIPSVEDVQDVVEEVLINNKLSKVAKSYILYRQKRAEVRYAKEFFGVRDELKLSVNAIRVLEKRYLLKNNKGEVVENPTEMFGRVAKAVAVVDKKYKENQKKSEEEFYNMMVELEFLPNSPTLMNAGTNLGQLSACFVLPIEDSLKSIFKAVNNMALIHQSGGGTGFSFSKIRPKGDIVKSTKGVASGPLSFVRVFDTTTDVIKQGGRRRGANMGILRVDHPDIIEFITAKSREGFLSNFNLSVAVTNKFMKAVEKNKEFDLINPRTGESVRKIKAKDIFDLIVTMAWKSGDPGMVFIDTINKHNPLPDLGEIKSTNPCGEQPLLSYESCNLGSINLAKMVEDGKINWKKFGETIKKAVHFLDNVIDANKYPILEIEKITKANRKIGLGVMGFAEMLVQLEIPYDSEKALSVAEKVMMFMKDNSHKASQELAKKREAFPNMKKSVWKKKMRNATTTTIAPTGSISIIAGCSSGIEPLFAVSFIRNIMEGTRLLETNHYFEEIAKKEGFYSKELMMKIATKGSVQGMKEVPKKVQKIFRTALDIEPEWHIKIQAAFQKYTDNAVSKTVNFSHDATVDEIEKVYKLAYKLKCKGVTIYRYGSKSEQVLYIGPAIGRELGETLEYVSAESEYAGGCPDSFCPH